MKKMQCVHCGTIGKLRTACDDCLDLISEFQFSHEELIEEMEREGDLRKQTKKRLPQTGKMTTARKAAILYMDGWSCKKIGEHIGVSTSTARRMIAVYINWGCDADREKECRQTVVAGAGLPDTESSGRSNCDGHPHGEWSEQRDDREDYGDGVY